MASNLHQPEGDGSSAQLNEANKYINRINSKSSSSFKMGVFIFFCYRLANHFVSNRSSSPRAAKLETVEVEKEEKPEDTIPKAELKINLYLLKDFLERVSDQYRGQHDDKLRRLVRYLDHNLSGDSASQFLAVDLLRNSVAEIADKPVSYLPGPVYVTLIEWTSQFDTHYGYLEDFFIWALDCILADMETQKSGSGSSKPQSSILLVLAVVLRGKPESMIKFLTTLRINSKYQEVEKLPVVIWMIVQASHGDIAVGLYMWSGFLLPLLGLKSGSDGHLRNLVLQPVERILATPSARDILVLSNPIMNWLRLIPPASLELLLHLTYPTASARVEETGRFVQLYPTLKVVALSGDPQCSTMELDTCLIQIIALKAIIKGNPALSEEAISIFLWTLTRTAECYSHWGKIYEDHREASVAVLRKLLDSWNHESRNLYFLKPLSQTLKQFMRKNKKILSSSACGQALVKESDKYCKAVLRRASRDLLCMDSILACSAISFMGLSGACLWFLFLSLISPVWHGTARQAPFQFKAPCHPSMLVRK